MNTSVKYGRTPIHDKAQRKSYKIKTQAVITDF